MLIPNRLSSAFLISVVAILGGAVAAQPFVEWDEFYEPAPGPSVVGGGDDLFGKNCVTTDSAGNVYVAGYQSTVANGTDYAVVKYDSTGAQQWFASYDGTGNTTDIAFGIAVDAAGGVYVTGRSSSGGANFDIATVKFDSSGAFVWDDRYSGPAGSAHDEGRDIAIDGAGNVYVTGYATSAGSNEDVVTIKYTSGGTQSWVRLAGAAPDDRGYALAVDSSNAVIVTGRSGTSGAFDYITAKYDAAGNIQWGGPVLWNSSGNANDIAHDVVVDSAGNIYVTGPSLNAGGAGLNNFATIKYDGATGLAMWGPLGTDFGALVWDSSNNLDDTANALALDSAGFIVVTGHSSDGTDTDFATIKYHAGTGATSWGGAGFDNSAVRWDGSGSGNDLALDLALDASGNIFVTGRSFNGSNDDVAIVKYDPAGAQQWADEQDSGSTDSAFGVEVAPSDKIVVGGTGEGPVSGLTAFWTIQFTEVPPPPTQVYVNPAWAGETPGNDPDAGGPATNFGYDSFATAQDAVNNVAAGGTIEFANATFATGITTNKSLTLDMSSGAILQGASPVITHTTGTLTVTGGTSDQTTAFPCILLTGGTLILDGHTVLESNVGDHFCVEIQGGTLDVTTNGGNVFQIRTTGGGFVDNRAGSPALDLTSGVTFMEDATTFTPGTLADDFAIEDRTSHLLDAAGVGLVTWVANNLFVTTNTLGLQAAIDAATAGDTIDIEAGLYDEVVTVNKALTIEGPNVGTTGLSGGRAAEAELTRTAGGGTSPLVDVTVPNVILDGLRLSVELAHASGGIRSTTAGAGTGLVVRNNVVRAVSGSLTGSFGVSVSDATGAPLISRNLIDGAAGSFENGVILLSSGGTVGGLAGTTNRITATVWDLNAVTTAVALTVRNNEFLGSGVNLFDPTAVVTVQQNMFTPSSSSPQALFLRFVNQAAVNVLQNSFDGHVNTAVISGASSSVTLTGNSFTPDNAAPNFTHVLVSSSYPSGGAASANPANDITLFGNVFNNAGTATGRALDFQNHNDDPGSGWGTITIGNSTGGNENIFDGALSQYLRLQFENAGAFLPPTFIAGGAPTAGHFDIDLDAEFNTFAGSFPTFMTPGERATLESKTFHKVDDSRVGLVDYGFNYLPTLTLVNNLGPTNEDVELDIPYATLFGAGNAADVDGTVDALVVTGITGLGVLEITPIATSIRVSVVLPQVVLPGDILHWDPNSNLNDTNNSGPALALTIVARDNLGADSAPAVGVSINVNPINDAPVVSGPATLNLNEDASAPVNLGFTDLDMPEGTDSARVTLSVSDGILNLATVSGLTFNTGANGAASMDFQGGRPQVLAAIATVTYVPNGDFNGTDSLDFDVFDLGNFGAPGQQTDSLSVAITVNALNDAPVATGDASLTLDEDTTDTVTLSFSDVDIDEVASPPGIALFTLSATNGTLTLAQTTGLTLVSGGTGTNTMQYTGNTVDINAAVLTVTYDPDPDYFGGDTIVFTVNDQGNTGAPGAQSDTHNVAVTVNAVNDAPTLTAVDPNLLPTATEDTLRTITFAELAAAADEADVDSSPVNFVVRSVTSGTLTFDDGFVSGQVVVFHPAAGFTVIDSTITLEWTPGADENNDTNGASPLDAFVVRAFDGALPSTADVQVSVNTNPVNDAPSFTPTVAAPTVDEDAGPVTIVGWAPGAAGPSFDAGGGSDEAATQAPLSYSVQGFTNGGLFAGGSDPAISFNGTNWDFSFESGPDLNGSSDVTIRVTDDGPTGAPNVEFQDLIFTITVTSINDEPSFSPGAGFEIAPFATIGPKTVANWATGMSPGPADESGQLLNFAVSAPTIVTGTIGFVSGPAIDPGTGELTFEIAAGADGIATFQVTLEDNGAAAPPPNDNVSPAVTLIVAMRQAQVYVDLADVALAYGDGPTTGFFFGIDAFAVVQDGLDNVADAGTVSVASNASNYDEALISRSVTLDLTAGPTLIGDGVPVLGVTGGTVQVNGGTLEQSSASNDPAVLLLAGTVDIDGTVIQQNTDEDAVRIDGADTTLSNTQVFESSAGARLAINLVTGLLDAGAGNTFHIVGPGAFIDNQTAGSVDAVGNTWDNDGTPLDPVTRAGGFGIEDLVTHALDNAAFGLVRWDVDSLYVTQASNSVQRGVDNSNPGDSLEVGIGLFSELIVIPLPLTVNGEQAGNPGAGRLPVAPISESILLAPGGSAPGDAVVRVFADNVAFDGLVIDGNSAAGTGLINNPGLGFVDIDNLLLDNNVLQNFLVQGVRLSGAGGVTENELRDNAIIAPGLFGVSSDTDMFVDLFDNTIDGFGAIGIAVLNHTQNRGAATRIEGNTLGVADGTVAIELVALNLVSTAPIQVNTNTIDADLTATGAPGTFGISLREINGDTDLSLTGNLIGGAGGLFDRGVSLFSLPTTAGVSFSGGTIGNSNFGVHLGSVDPIYGPAPGASIVDFTGLTTQNTCDTGIRAQATNTGFVPVEIVQLNLVSCDIQAVTVGVRVETDTPTVTSTANLFQTDVTAGTGILGTGADSIIDFDQSSVTSTGDGIDLMDGLLDLTASDLDAGGDAVLIRAGGSISSFANNFIVAGGVSLRVLAGAGTISAVTDNSFDGSAFGIDNQTAVLIVAEDNWWGSTRGPTHPSSPGGNGVGVSNDVDFSPWWASGNDVAPVPGFQGGDTGPSLFGDIRHAIPTELEWSIQPPNGTAGIALSPGPRVRARDANDILGYNWDAANGDAFLVFANNPTGASLQGNPVIQAVNGLAHFTNAAVSTGGVGFTVFVIGDYGPFSLANSPISLPFNIDNLVPTISGVTPTFVNEGIGAFTIQVDGSNYNSTTVVRFNGSDRPTFFVNPTRLLAALTSADTATGSIGTHNVTVHNPSPGGGTTGPLPFIVNDIPDDISLTPASVAENQASGTIVGGFGTTDTGPAPDSHSYSLVAGIGAQDNGSFQIVGANLQTAATFDFETKSSYSIRVRSTDSRGAWFEKVFTISVNDVNEAPTAVADTYTVDEDGTLNVNATLGLLANDSDPDGSGHFAVLDTPPNDTQPSFSLNPDGSFLLAPNPNFFGAISFTYHLEDGANSSATVAVSVTVNPVNDAPSFTLLGNTASDEDAGPQTLAGAGSAFNAGPGESDGVLAYEIVANNNAGLFSVLPAIDTSGQLSYTAAPNANGAATLDVRVRDNGGTASGGVDVSGVQQIVITVNPINDAPGFTVAPSNSIITRAEDSGPTTITGWAGFTPGPANESAQGVQQYNISNVSNPTLLAGGTPAVANNGELTFTPALNQNGSTTFDVSVTDNGGAPGVDTSAIQTFTIQITPVNDAPTLTTVNLFTGATEDTPFNIPFGTLQTEADEADVDGDPVHFRVDSLIGGTLTMNGNPVVPGTTVFSTGSLLWTPPANQTGNLPAFTVLAWDGLLASSIPATVTVSVAGANDAPVITANALLNIAEGDTNVFVDAAHLTTTDLEDSAVDLTYTLTTDPLRGVLRLNGTLLAAGTANDNWTQDDIDNDRLTYDHDASEFSSDSFAFDVADTGPLTVSGTFNISIAPVNDAPTVAPGTLAAAGTEDTAYDILFSDLVTTTSAADVDGNIVGFTASNLSSGTLQIDQTGTSLVFVPYASQVIDGSDILRWTPPNDANGAFTPFDVVAIDDGTPGSLISMPAAISININAVNDIPSINVPTPAVVAEDTAGTITLVGWAQMNPGGGTDEAGQQVSSFSAPTNLSNPGLFSSAPSVAPNAANGDLSFALTPDAFGVCSFDITVTDDGSPTATSVVHTFSITVTSVNDAPTLSFISVIFGGPEDSLINIPFAVLQGAANEADIDSSPVNFLVEPIAANGVAQLNSTPFTTPTLFTAADILEWQPAADINGTIVGFNVWAFDGALQSASSRPLQIFVEPVNDIPSFSASNPAASLEDAGPITVLNWAMFDAGPTNEDTTQAVLNYTVSNVVAQVTGNLTFVSGPTIDNNGNLHYEAATNTNGTATFQATVRDTGGTASGGVDTSVLSAAFTITVTEVNDAPSFGVNFTPAAVDEDSGVSAQAGFVSVTSFGPSDEASQGINDWIVDQISNPGLFTGAGQPDVTGAGDLVFTPAADAFGTSTFRVRLQDTGGTANGGVDLSAGQTFTITVNPVNDAPSVTGGSSPTVAEDAGAQTISNFVGINPGPANESSQVALNYTIQNLTLSGGLTFSATPSIDASGTLTFTTDADSNGSADFQVQVQDNGGTPGVDTSALSAVFTITVTPVNDAPTLTTVGLLSGAHEDTAFTITYATLAAAADEADIDSTPVNFRVEGVTTGTLTKGGSPVVAGSTTLAATESLVWTPAADQNGTQNAFTIAAWDGALASATPVQVQVQVTAINDEPSFTKGTNITVAWDQGSQTIPGWASAISAGPADESSQTLTFAIVSNNNPGLFSTQPSVSSAGTLSFVPNTNVSGTASISIELMDNGGTANGGDDLSPPQSFTITITTAGEIDVTRGASVPDGSSDTVGTTVPVLTPLNLTYTVVNTGNGLLQLTNTTTPVVVLSTTNCDAWVTHQPSTTLVTTTSSNFVVHIVPLSAGTFDVDLLIDNTDANENPYDITIDGTAVDAPNIGLERGFVPDIPSGGSDSFGVIPVAVPTSFTYVVRNDGTADLTFGSPAVSTSAELNCSVAITQPVGPIAAAGSENLVIDVTPTVTGIFSFILEIDSNDPDEDPFTVFVSGDASASAQPELELFGRFVLAPMDTENVGLIPSGSNTTFLYEVRNVGAAPLTVTNAVSITNPINCVAVVTVVPGTSVAPETMTVLGIDVQPIAPGPFQFDFELITNDADESPLPVTVSGQSTASVVPEIAVDRDGNPITNGATDDIGDLPLGVFSTFVYRVRNEGTSTLNVNRPVTVSGETNCEVFIWTFPDVNIAPQDDSLLIVGIRPLATGALGAILDISNNDSDEGNFLIDIIGTGPEADIRVESPEFTPIASGDPLAAPGGKAGATIPLNLWVRNVGTGDLNIVGVSASSEVNCTATIVSSGTTPVTPGTATTLTIDVVPTAAGAYSFTLTITTNDPDTGNYVIFVSGTASKSGGGGGGDDSGCSTGEGTSSWLLLLAALSALVVATRTLRTRKQ